MGGLDGITSKQAEASAKDVTLEVADKRKFSSISCDWFMFVGLIGYFIVLYGVYAGYFTALMHIALAVRGDNYHRLERRLEGSWQEDNSYSLPWEVLLRGGATRS